MEKLLLVSGVSLFSTSPILFSLHFLSPSHFLLLRLFITVAPLSPYLSLSPLILSYHEDLYQKGLEPCRDYCAVFIFVGPSVHIEDGLWKGQVSSSAFFS